MALLSRSFRAKRSDPTASLMGMKGSPGTGATLKQPNLVCTTLGAGVAAHTAGAGRALNCAAPNRSAPVVILKGGPELAIKYGLTRKPFGMLTVPTTNTRWR